MTKKERIRVLERQVDKLRDYVTTYLGVMEVAIMKLNEEVFPPRPDKSLVTFTGPKQKNLRKG